MKRTTKALLIGLAIIVGSSLLAGCIKEDTKYTKYDVDVFEYDYEQRILVDKKTGVQYIVVGGGTNQCMSVRLDADGKPMIDRSVK